MSGLRGWPSTPEPEGNMAIETQFSSFQGFRGFLGVSRVFRGLGVLGFLGISQIQAIPSADAHLLESCLQLRTPSPDLSRHSGLGFRV